MRRRRPASASCSRALAAAVAAALAVARPAAALEEVAPGSGGALRIVADPPRLVLGDGAAAELRISAPAEVEEVALSANVGRLEGLQRIAGGFAARYRPPVDRVPQVAIVSAVARTARGPIDGWLAIPLSGRGDARVRARPGADVALRIGDRTFGPARAGRDGIAVVAVVVPPGVREAHHGFVPIDLNVPESALLHAVADRGQVLADRAEQVHVVAYAVAPHGAARHGDVPVFEASRGSVVMAPRETGAYEGTWTVPPGAAGEQRLAVQLQGSTASRSVLRLDAVAGPPATVAVAFDRPDVEAGVSEVVVTARVLDAAGNPTAGTLELETDGGTLSAASRSGTGAVTARLAVPSRFEGRDRLVVTARATTAGITGARALPLVPGPAAVARFAPSGAVLVADGAREATLRLDVKDRFGNPVAARAPALEADQGRVLAVAETGPGAWSVRYLAPAVPRRAEAGLAATVGGARARADLLLVPPRAQLAVLATGGVVADARGRFAAPHAGLAVERPVSLPLELRGGLSAAWRLECEYLGWSGSDREEPLNGNRTAVVPEATRAGVFLGGVSAALPLRHGPELWGSATFGLALASTRPRDGSSDTGMAPAARVGFSAGWPLRLATPFLEISVLTAGRSPGGAFTAFGLAAGARFDVEGRHGDHPDRR